MFRFVVLALTVSSAFAYGGGYGGAGLGLALPAPLLARSHGGYARSLGPITAAVQSTRSYEVVPVALNYEAAVPQTIDVPANIQPVNIIFRTQSSPLNVQQIHTPSAPQYESTRSEEQASVLNHESFRPVIQNYRETIQPFRNIEQRVQPVIEHVNTVVAKGEEYRAAPLVAPLGYAGKALAGPLPLLSRSDYK